LRAGAFFLAGAAFRVGVFFFAGAAFRVGVFFFAGVFFVFPDTNSMRTTCAAGERFGGILQKQPC
jgi:hypothetical protein